MKTVERDLKHRLYDYCLAKLESQHQSLQEAVTLAREALGSETKSTAGDKHETGRAMIQLEQEKLGQQVATLVAAIQHLHRLPFANTFEKVAPGALVETDAGTYFISTGIGKLSFEKQEYFIVAPNSPIALALLGKGRGETIVFNKKRITLLSIE